MLRVADIDARGNGSSVNAVGMGLAPQTNLLDVDTWGTGNESGSCSVQGIYQPKYRDPSSPWLQPHFFGQGVLEGLVVSIV